MYIYVLPTSIYWIYLPYSYIYIYHDDVSYSYISPTTTDIPLGPSPRDRSQVELPAAAANPEGRRALLREQIQRAEPCGAELRGDGFLGESRENHGKIHGKTWENGKSLGKSLGK